MPDNYYLTPESEEDLREIWNYSMEEWGEEQADKYLAEIYERFEWLTENLPLGHKRSEIEEGRCSYPQGSHFIVYMQLRGRNRNSPYPSRKNGN
ncbi:MAG: type II toxin-antitoxin system RelE/ParE family toxin [Thiohalomonadales bacterium]